MTRYPGARRYLFAAALSLALCVGPGQAAAVPTPSEIVAIDLAGRQTNLTQNTAWDLAPAVSSDGRIAFLSTRDGAGDLYVMDGDGRNVRRLTTSPFDDSKVAWLDTGITQASWSRDGARIAFDAAAASIPPGCFHDCIDWSTYVVADDGSGLRLIESSARAPAWSPAGRRLAYEGGYDSYDRTTASITITPGPVKVRALNVDPQSGPVWSPNGRELAFQAFVGGEKPPTSVFVVGANDKHKRLLAKGRDPVWSPDGHRIAFITNYRLVSIGVDGTGKRRLSRNGELVLYAAWSRKGTLAVVVASSLDPFGGAPSNLRVETVSPDGKGLRVVAREPAGSRVWSAPVWAPDGKRLIVALG